MHANTHPDLVLRLARDRHDELRKAADHARMVRAAKRRPDERHRRRRRQ